MTLTALLWLATACYGIHILEEYQLNWRDWARSALKLPVEWSDFYVVNALVIVLGIVAANLAAWPGVALAFPALMLINATFFHVLPVIRMNGRFSPGLITAIVLFFPVAIACYWRAAIDGKTERHGADRLARSWRAADGDPGGPAPDQGQALFPSGGLTALMPGGSSRPGSNADPLR